ncbi:MAG: hypothetical protein KUF77_15445 [Candidatus Thiodiazotropha sp. (ex Lucina aurantia)]|nr:hypothetical protein [Candidatus Thiodiazotropha sp. (ex Codakia orbicularis)]MBV2099516.1 hypothetical protein [Candidatus Thiodiazotropha sp. (ex Codakia orbicularis)]MBV2104419.1 hypothetical protein [Candidatus Thiodiazotropha sp. (ex Lucina aurantia)]MBV2118799.1 hypothetical protein [Candidatus Thiodiazotropha sp. (ex Lucina aurantia)]
MSKLFEKKPSTSWVAGDERKTPKGTSIGGTRTNSYWVARLTEEETDSETWQLEDYLEKIYKEISTKVESLASFFDSGGRLELSVSLFGARNFGLVLSPDLLSRLGTSKIELLLDIYPER